MAYAFLSYLSSIATNYELFLGKNNLPGLRVFRVKGLAIRSFGIVLGGRTPF